MKCLYPRKLFAFLALACFADVNAFDFTSDGLYYNKLTDSTCEVTFKDSTFNSYSGMVVVPSVVNYEGTDYEVVKVGSKAFYDSKVLSKVLLPDNITVIGDGAFKNCSKLVSFNFPENLDSICDNAFECCRNLKSPELKEGLKYIGAYAFAECNAIQSVSVPNSVEVLGSSSFSWCI